MDRPNATILETQPPPNAVVEAPSRRRMGIARGADRLLVLLFVLALWAPLLGTWLKWDSAQAQPENRILAAMPALPKSLRQAELFPRHFFAYFSDHFGFRQTLIHWHALAVYHWLHESPNPSVIIGKDGWLFLASEGSLDSYRRTEPFTQKQLAEWDEILRQRRDWLGARGMYYQLIIPPDKQTIYPEYMPDRFKPLDRPSRLDQLLQYEKTHSRVPIEDLRPNLLRRKKQTVVYLHTDTHWNILGAFAGYHHLASDLEAVLPAIKPSKRSDFADGSSVGPAGDLAMLMGMNNVLTEDYPGLWPKTAFPWTIPPEIEGQTISFNGTDPHLPRLVMFRDSFVSSMLPFLLRNFSRSVFVWQDEFDPAVVEAEHPDVVVQEFVERKLMLPPPHNPPRVAEAPKRPVDAPPAGH